MLYIYFSGFSAYFGFLFWQILQDKEARLDDPILWRVAMIAGLFWPVVIPISLLELKAKAKAKARQAELDVMPRPFNSGRDGEETRYIRQIKLVESEEDIPVEPRLLEDYS